LVGRKAGRKKPGRQAGSKVGRQTGMKAGGREGMQEGRNASTELQYLKTDVQVYIQANRNKDRQTYTDIQGADDKLGQFLDQGI
jgi:hypothetical protein